MRDLTELNQYRITDPSKLAFVGGWPGDGTCGAFNISLKGTRLHCIASSADGWDHVSVSLWSRIPTWLEMQHVQRLFFKPDELVWQYHMPPARHVDIHPHVLHLWRKHDFEMPLPPVEFV